MQQHVAVVLPHRQPWLLARALVAGVVASAASVGCTKPWGQTPPRSPLETSLIAVAQSISDDALRARAFAAVAAAVAKTNQPLARSLGRHAIQLAEAIPTDDYFISSPSIFSGEDITRRIKTRSETLDFVARRLVTVDSKLALQADKGNAAVLARVAATLVKSDPPRAKAMFDQVLDACLYRDYDHWDGVRYHDYAYRLRQRDDVVGSLVASDPRGALSVARSDEAFLTIIRSRAATDPDLALRAAEKLVFFPEENLDGDLLVAISYITERSIGCRSSRSEALLERLILAADHIGTWNDGGIDEDLDIALGLCRRATALGWLAGALSGVNEARAKAIFKKALRLADSVGPVYLARGLKDEVQTAQALSCRAQALGAIAAAMARMAPRPAAALFDQAIQEAKLVQYHPPKSTGTIVWPDGPDLGWIAKNKKEEAAEEAIVLGARNRALSDLSTRLARIDLHRALRVANVIREGWRRDQALEGIVRSLARTGPQRALQIAESIQDDASRARAVAITSAALASRDPLRAQSLFAETIHIAEGLDEDTRGFISHSMVRGIAESLVKLDPLQSQPLFAEPEHLGKNTKGYVASYIGRAIMESLAKTDLRRAENLLHQAVLVVDGIKDDSAKAYALESIALVIAGNPLD